jgi:hypothetical protein
MQGMVSFPCRHAVLCTCSNVRVDSTRGGLCKGWQLVLCGKCLKQATDTGMQLCMPAAQVHAHRLWIGCLVEQECT